MSYNAVGQMTELDRYSSGNLTDEVSTTTFAYDGDGNMTGQTDVYGVGTSFTGTITYANTFDDADRWKCSSKTGPLARRKRAHPLGHGILFFRPVPSTPFGLSTASPSD
jgi:YD repeat-containing protein